MCTSYGFEIREDFGFFSQCAVCMFLLKTVFLNTFKSGLEFDGLAHIAISKGVEPVANVPRLDCYILYSLIVWRPERCEMFSVIDQDNAMFQALSTIYNNTQKWQSRRDYKAFFARVILLIQSFVADLMMLAIFFSFLHKNLDNNSVDNCSHRWQRWYKCCWQKKAIHV